MNLEKNLDLNFYILMNKDIAQKFNNNKNEIKNYFLNTKNKDKRLFSIDQSDFFIQYDWNKYIKNNSDLIKKNINSDLLGFKHYMEHGKFENRIIYKIDQENKNTNIDNNNYNDNINIEFCKLFYPDLFSTKSNIEIMNYFKNHKNKKNMVFSNKHCYLYNHYDWNLYIQNNSDLIKNNIYNVEDAFIHYIKYGQYEERIIYLKQHEMNNVIIEKNTKMEIKVNHEINKEINNEINNNEKKEIESNLKNNNEKKEIESNLKNKNKKKDNVILKDEYKNTSNDILKEFKNNNSEKTLELLKENLIIQNHFLNLPFSNNIEKISIDLYNNDLLTSFDPIYYYKMNKDNYSLEDDKLFLINHFFNIGMKDFLPFNKQHYLIYINSDWENYKINNKIEKETNYLALINYLKYKIYFNKHVQINLKYNKNDFNNHFYNELNNYNNNSLINYYLFLNDENEHKLFPDIFNYFIYKFINWNEFNKNNKLNLSINESFYYFIKTINSFDQLNIQFLNINNLNIVKDKLIHHKNFKPFILNVFNYISKNTTSISKANSDFNTIFNYKILNIPDKFNIINENNNISSSIELNIFIHYLNNNLNLINLLNSIFLQNFKKIKIFIVNIIDDNKLIDKINEIKKIKILESIKIEIIEIKDINSIELVKYIKFNEMNMILNDNIYFKNTNVINYFMNLINTNHFNTIFYQKNKNNQHDFLLLNSCYLINNPHLIINYYLYESNNRLKNNALFINNIKNEYNYEHLYKDFEKNIQLNHSIPIYVFFKNKNNIIQYPFKYEPVILNNQNNFNEETKSILKFIKYEYIIFIQMDKIENIKYIHFDILKEKSSSIIQPIYYKSRRKKNLDTIDNKKFKLDDYEAFICNTKMLLNKL